MFQPQIAKTQKRTSSATKSSLNYSLQSTYLNKLQIYSCHEKRRFVQTNHSE
jgi:hypothetical protein